VRMAPPGDCRVAGPLAPSGRHGAGAVPPAWGAPAARPSPSGPTRPCQDASIPRPLERWERHRIVAPVSALGERSVRCEWSGQ
jgi:hypothetical protein